MSKRITKNAASKINLETLRALRDTRITATTIARIGGFDPSYVRHVLRGDRPPSERLNIAISRALLQRARQLDYAALLTEHPQAEAGA